MTTLRKLMDEVKKPSRNTDTALVHLDNLAKHLHTCKKNNTELEDQALAMKWLVDRAVALEQVNIRQARVLIKLLNNAAAIDPYIANGTSQALKIFNGLIEVKDENLARTPENIILGKRIYDLKKGTLSVSDCIKLIESIIRLDPSESELYKAELLKLKLTMASRAYENEETKPIEALVNLNKQLNEVSRFIASKESGFNKEDLIKNQMDAYHILVDHSIDLYHEIKKAAADKVAREWEKKREFEIAYDSAIAEQRKQDLLAEDILNTAFNIALQSKNSELVHQFIRKLGPENAYAHFNQLAGTPEEKSARAEILLRIQAERGIFNAEQTKGLISHVETIKLDNIYAMALPSEIKSEEKNRYSIAAGILNTPKIVKQLYNDPLGYKKLIALLNVVNTAANGIGSTLNSAYAICMGLSDPVEKRLLAMALIKNNLIESYQIDQLLPIIGKEGALKIHREQPNNYPLIRAMLQIDGYKNEMKALLMENLDNAIWVDNVKPNGEQLASLLSDRKNEDVLYNTLFPILPPAISPPKINKYLLHIALHHPNLFNPESKKNDGNTDIVKNQLENLVKNADADDIHDAIRRLWSQCHSNPLAKNKLLSVIHAALKTEKITPHIIHRDIVGDSAYRHLLEENFPEFRLIRTKELEIAVKNAKNLAKEEASVSKEKTAAPRGSSKLNLVGEIQKTLFEVILEERIRHVDGKLDAQLSEIYENKTIFPTDEQRFAPRTKEIIILLRNVESYKIDLERKARSCLEEKLAVNISDRLGEIISTLEYLQECADEIQAITHEETTITQIMTQEKSDALSSFLIESIIKNIGDNNDQVRFNSTLCISALYILDASKIESLIDFTYKKTKSLDELYVICFRYIKDEDLKIYFLNKINDKFISENGIKRAYEICTSTYSDDIRSYSLVKAILSSDQVSTLTEEELQKITEYLNPDEAILIIKNSSIENKERLIKYVQESYKRYLESYLSHTAKTLLDETKDMSQFTLVTPKKERKIDIIHDLSQRLFNAEVDASRIEDEKSHESAQEALTTGLRIAEIPIKNVLTSIAKQLQSTTKKLADSKYIHDAKEVKQRRHERTLLTGGVGGAASYAIRNTWRREEFTLKDKNKLVQILQNMTSTLTTIKLDTAYTAIDQIISLTNIENAYDIWETHPSLKTKFLFARSMLSPFNLGKILAHPYREETIDQFNNRIKVINGQGRIDNIINISAAEANNRLEIYSLFNEHRNTDEREHFARGILKSKNMRGWLLESKHHSELKTVLDKCQPLFERNTDADALESKAIFDNWTLQDFYLALSRPPLSPRNHNNLIWGMLTQPDRVAQLSPDEIKDYVKQIDFTALPPQHIKLLDKNARIAFLKTLDNWETAKTNVSSDFLKGLLDRSEALTHDFTPEDIQSLEHHESALIISFKQNPKKVTQLITEGPSPKRKAAWEILEQLHNGFLRVEDNADLHQAIYATTKSLIGSPLRHQLVSSAAYQYQPNDSYALSSSNSLVNFDLLTNPNKFRDNATLAAFRNLVFSNPIRINELQRSNKLKGYVEQAAALGYSATVYLALIKQLQKNDDRDIQAAGNYLLDCLPHFLKKNKTFNDADINAIIELNNLYRLSHPVDQTVSYKKDPILKALFANKNDGKRKAIGPIIFSDPDLIKSFVASKNDYETPQHWFIRFIKVVLLGALIGAVVGGVIKIATDASKIFGNFIGHLFDGPSKWFSGQQDSIKNVFGSAITGTATFLGLHLAGIGASSGFISAVVPILAPIIVAGATGALLTGTLYAAWQGTKAAGSWMANRIKKMFGYEVLKEAQEEYEIISNALMYCKDAKDFSSKFYDENTRNNFAKMLIYIADNGYKLSETAKTPPKEGVFRRIFNFILAIPQKIIDFVFATWEKIILYTPLKSFYKIAPEPPREPTPHEVYQQAFQTTITMRDDYYWQSRGAVARTLSNIFISYTPLRWFLTAPDEVAKKAASMIPESPPAVPVAVSEEDMTISHHKTLKGGPSPSVLLGAHPLQQGSSYSDNRKHHGDNLIPSTPKVTSVTPMFSEKKGATSEKNNGDIQHQKPRSRGGPTSSNPSQ